MNTILSFMDKLYSDSKTLSIVYAVGAVLLFIFIILLMVSLRKGDKKETTKIIEEPKIDDEPTEKIDETKEESKENTKTESNLVSEAKQDEKDNEEKNEQSLEQSIFEKTVIIPLNEIDKTTSREENIAQALDNVEKIEEKIEPSVEEKTKEKVQELSKDIPNVDDFVDNVVKKTYEKNEQFSSVFVGNNTSTIKLDKVMENLNVDEDVKESIVPEEEKSEIPKTIEPEITNKEVLEKEIEIPAPASKSIEDVVETPKVVESNIDTTVSLDNLKNALEEKQKEVSTKQDDLKAKLEGLKKEHPKSNETMKAEDLLNKLNSMKEK